MSESHVEGLPRFRARVDAARDELRRGLKREVVRAVTECQAEARARCPVDSGRLRNSIALDVREEPGRTVGTVGTSVHYARHVEHGTRRMHARPFMFPAFELAVANFRRRIASLRERLR
jgi:HK97 gp10 family phage protein